MIYFLFLYLFMLLFAYVIQKMVHKRKKPVENPGKPWGKFVVFALIVPMVGLIYSIPNSNLWFVLHGVIALAACIEAIRQQMLQKPPIFLSMLILVCFGAILINFLYASRYHETGIASSLLSIYFTVVIFDGYAQLVGQLLGKRKVFPGISPNKTIAGIWGGAIASFLASFSLSMCTEHYMFSWWQIPIIILFAILGDAAASGWKRFLRVKDFSDAIPYQGGFIDRFDSYMFACLTLPLFTLRYENF